MTRARVRPPDGAPGPGARPGAPVLLTIDSLDGGGAERYVVDLAIALRERGWPVEVACSVGGVRAAALAEAGVPVHLLMASLVKRRVSPGYGHALRRLVQHRSPAVLHAHLFASAAAAVQATRGLPTPLVVTEHTEAPWRGAAARAVSRIVYHRADHIIAVSSAIQALLVDHYDVPSERLEVLLPTTTPIAGAAAPTVDRTTRGPVIGAVGRLVAEKGIDIFLNAAALVSSVVPQARFVIVGDGPLRADLQRQATALALDGVATFTGYRADAPELIARLDVLAVPSHSDGSPLVVCEAMAAGIPVVASRVGGLTDLVQDGDSGLLVSPGQPEELARALVSLLMDPAAAVGMGSSARDLASTRSHARLVNRMTDIYSALAPTQADMPR